MNSIIQNYFIYHVSGRNFGFNGKGLKIRRLITKDIVANADVYNVVIETVDGVTLQIPESIIEQFTLTYGLEDD